MKLARVILLTALALIAMLAVPPPSAHAADASAKKKGAELYGQALDRFDAGQFEKALQLFIEVDSLLESPNARLYTGRCLRELGRLPEAFEAMNATVQLATEKAKADPSYVKTRDAAAAERAALATKIGRVVVAVSDPPPGLQITVNERNLVDEMVGEQLGVEPGSITIVARAPKYDTERREVDVAVGGIETVAIALRPALTGLGDDDDDDDDDSAGDDGSNGLLTAGFVSMGVGVAGMVMFAVAGVMANERFSQIEDECGGPPCTDPKYTDLIEEGKTMDLVANIGIGIGAAGLAAGALMVILGVTGDSGGNDSAAWSIEVGPHGGLLGFRRRF